MKPNCITHSLLDKCLLSFDRTLKNLSLHPAPSVRPNPADACADAALLPEERRRAAGLMRVNHTGEVCAQALYKGQALTARTAAIRAQLEHAAQEEGDHLAWCAQRLSELRSRASLLNPLWYLGSLTLGIAAGLSGDRLSLGFLAETERQVEAHLTKHLTQLPPADSKSRQLLETMRADEAQHANTAVQAGAAELPPPLKLCMTAMSKIMTKTVFWI